MLQAVRIEGLRSLTDTDFIDIKPLTILVGENSSGKSTFLRFFPLLKQSFAANTSGPILWGDPSFVDFGTYQEAIQNNFITGIRFHFKFSLKELASSVENIQKSFFDRTIINENIEVYLMIELSENIKKEATRVSKIECKIADSIIQIEITEDGKISKFNVNSSNILQIGAKFDATHLSSRSILPIINEIKKKPNEHLIRYRSNLPPQSVLYNKLYEEVKILSKPSKSKAKILLTTAFICMLGSSEAILKRIKKANDATYWKKSTDNWDIDNPEFQRIRDLAIAVSIPYFIEVCDRYFFNLAKNINYMGPSRAAAEQRSRRFQEFAVDEGVDSKGQNLSLFLKDLDENSKKEFDNWTSKYFEFRTVIQTNHGHITLNLVFGDSKQEINIADTGFGFSQMLPIITQLWLLSQKKKDSLNVNTLPIIFAIEQPELHLHPRMQKVLTDVLVSTVQAAKDNNIDLRLLIETHSEVLVNQVGNLIYKEKIKPEDVNIVVFDKLPQESSSTVKIAYYNQEGFLKKWPVGFFDPGLE
jgi:predicted ATPase